MNRSLELGLVDRVYYYCAGAESINPNVQRYGAWRLKEISRSVGDEVS